MSDLLLDTCALLWLAEGTELDADARKAIADGNLRVSPISVWEIANLVRKRRIVLAMPVVKWVRQTLEKTEAALSGLPIEILAGSCELPGSPPSDPADRIIIATARESSMILMTRDKDILSYSRGGYVRTMAC
ncbi:MAG TPA: type II toxin-antitoxin system VapC family toxin [Xanthobacteraceae bacterium]|jgi:PIN domain nuclease of toxin-antitoxin system|nr:type II toxin-antitoxin system VapC family toxin [Xanthobacteraceae bacterium]